MASTAPVIIDNVIPIEAARNPSLVDRVVNKCLDMIKSDTPIEEIQLETVAAVSGNLADQARYHLRYRATTTHSYDLHMLTGLQSKLTCIREEMLRYAAAGQHTFTRRDDMFVRTKAFMSTAKQIVGADEKSVISLVQMSDLSALTDQVLEDIYAPILAPVYTPGIFTSISRWWTGLFGKSHRA